jgi:hypothetical protein
VVVLIFQQLIVINFRKNQNFVRVSVDEWMIYIRKIFQCLAITTVSRPFVPPMVPTRTLPSNNYDQQGSYSNDYSGSSSLTRSSSSSYGGASNDLVQTPVNGGGYGGAGNFGTGYNR